MTLVEFRGDLWIQKTTLPGLSCGVVRVIVRLAVLVELRLVTDGRTDTGPWLVLWMHSRAVKIVKGHVTLNTPPYYRTLTCLMPVLFTFNLPTKFEMSTFIRSKYMAWAQRCRNGSHDHDPVHLRDSQAAQS